MLSFSGELTLDTRPHRPCSPDHIYPPSVFFPAPPSLLRRASFRRLSNFLSVSPDAHTPPPTCLLPHFPLQPRRPRHRRGESTFAISRALSNDKSSKNFRHSPTTSSTTTDPHASAAVPSQLYSTSWKKPSEVQIHSHQYLKKRTHRYPR